MELLVFMSGNPELSADIMSKSFNVLGVSINCLNKSTLIIIKEKQGLGNSENFFLLQYQPN
jgi:hypothetical protein